MTSFVITPTNIDYLDSLFRDPITGKWVIPILTFNPMIPNPYFQDIDPLNNDPRYQKRVVDNIYMRLTEKWLYKEPRFRSLLKYFVVEKSGNKGTVSLITNPDKASEAKVNEDDRKHIFKYIEKYFITERFVRKVLKEYVTVTHVKWYDLFNNTDTLKDLFGHKLKKLIIATIYGMQDKPKKK